MARALIAWALRALAGCGVVAAALLSLDAAALGPKDPFTPPGRVSDAARSGELAAVAATPLVVGLAGLRLGHTPAALIDGEWISVGAGVRGARLHSVSMRGATLRHPDGRMERLALYPESSQPAAAAAQNDRLVVKRDLP